MQLRAEVLVAFAVAPLASSLVLRNTMSGPKTSLPLIMLSSKP